jgi:putative OPT family oligopeptide transporter
MTVVPLKSGDLMERAETAAPPSAAPRVERRRELTVRAVVFGCVVGAVLSAGNIYSGLKTGFIDGGGITAALLAFAFFAMIKRLSPAAFGARENNIAQTTASSAAVMGFAIGLPSAFPALGLMGHTFPGWALAGWGIAIGVVGIFVASTLREKLVVKERLPFPTGAATAEVILTIGAARQTAMRRAQLLIGTAALAMAFAWFRDGRPSLIPQTTMFGGVVLGVALSQVTVGIAWSPLMVSTGMLMGTRASVSMFIGGLVGWVGLAPWLVHTHLVPGSTYSNLNGWLIWPGVGMLLAGSLVPLVLDWRGLVRSFSDLAGFVSRAPDGAPAAERPATVPGAKTLLAGAVVLLFALGVGVFHVGIIVSVVGLVFAVVLANACGRTAGETDYAPTGAFGTITQLALGGSGVVGSVLGGSIVAGAAAQTSQTLWAFKAGERLGASPRAQLTAQLIGAVVGSVVAVPTYYVLVRAYGIATEAMPSPSALSWRATAEAVQHGFAAMPRYSPLAGAIGFGVGLLFAILARSRFARFVPSPAAMGVSIITPFSLSAAALIGGLVILVAKRLRPSGSAEASLMAVAAGSIAGESVMGVIVAALMAAGILSPG